jgi:hypothetical protein
MKLFKFNKRKKPILSTKLLAISNIVAFVAVIIVNYLATSLPIGWMSTGALSDLYPNLFVPVGMTFSIWGLIYLWLLWFVVWQIVDLFKKKGSEITKKIGVWFLLSCIANIGRIFAWHYRLVWLSVLVMLFFLVVLIVISYKIKIWKKLWTLWDKYLVQIPFSLYLWWISVATIANIATWLVNMWRSGRWISDIHWTMIVIAVATVLALLSLFRKNNIIYALVIVRAFIGIILKRLWAEVVYSEIIWLLWSCIVIVAFVIGKVFDKRKKK